GPHRRDAGADDPRRRLDRAGLAVDAQLAPGRALAHADRGRTIRCGRATHRRGAAVVLDLPDGQAAVAAPPGGAATRAGSLAGVGRALSGIAVATQGFSGGTGQIHEADPG